MDEKIFITGASGYIGSHLTQRLLSEGKTVHALVRNPEKFPFSAQDKLKIFKGDITDPKSLDEAISGCQKVYHVAAFAKVWDKDPSVFFRINVDGTINVLNAAEKAGIKRIVTTSTAGVFGASEKGIIDENSTREFDFFNEYESSKALAELKIRERINRGMDIRIVSPTRVYGPYLTGEPESVTLLIKKFVKNSWRMIPGDGSKKGNYVFIDDVIEGHIKAMETGKKGELYILAGENLSYSEFFDELKKQSGIERRMIPAPLAVQLGFARLQMLKTLIGGTPLITPKWVAKGRYHWEVSPQKSISELGIRITPFSEGLSKTLEWIKKKGS